MNRTEKEQVVQELAQRLRETQAVFLADYRGINVDQATQLRRELTQAGVEYRVVKNNLLKLAAQDTPSEELQPYCAGPTAIAFSGADPVAPAKILSKEISALAELPSREELLARALSSMNAPITNFVGTMAAVPRSLVKL